MFRMIRVRLALTYAGIALLVTLSLGAVLLIRLRAYYSGMELDYLSSNAKAISVMAVPLLTNKVPKDMRDAQISNLAFLSQTRVRILNPQQNVLADSGPAQSTKIGLGVMQSERVTVQAEPSPLGSSSVIVVQKQRINGPDQVSAEPPSSESGLQPPDIPLPGNGKPDIVFFNTSVPVSSGVYGIYLSKPMASFTLRSNQTVEAPILDATGKPLGYVELSGGPAYGREIVNSVASGLAVAGGLAVFLAILVGWLTSKRLIAPLLSLTEATQQMSGGDLSVRVAEAQRSDEFGILGKSFNQMASRIEETVQTLRRFLSDAAHELQTPLTALRTNLELARGESDSAAADRHLGLALEQIDRLQRLIKDLLSLSRLESGNGHETFERLDLRDLVRQVSEPFAARAEQASQAFELDLPEGAAFVLGSKDKLCGAVSNLLDNALKFTPQGGMVKVRLDEEPGDYCLTVRDTGIGIPPDELEMLFNRFHRARNAFPYPGSGLGLAIARTIALTHGGSVQAVNNPEGGASFILRLPRVDVDL